MSTKTIKYQDNSYLFIINQIDSLNSQNHKLLSIAHHITNHSLTEKLPKPPAIVAQIQQDLRRGFNTLIEALKEYFQDIDQKLKQINQFIQSKQLPHKKKNQQQQNGQIATLAKRIENLQQNLKKTQQNQTKILDIVQKIVHPLQQSTTIPKQKQYNHYETSFNFIKSQENSFNQLYPRPYSVIENENRQQSLKRQPSSAYCFPYGINHYVKSVPLGKRSLKGQKQIQQVKKSHKMNYMMKLLAK